MTMLPRSIPAVALLFTAIFSSTLALAQDNKALLDVLIQKGVLTADEAANITAELKKESSQNTTIVSGKMYIDVSSITAKTGAGVEVDPSGTGIDVKRFYLGATHIFDSMWSANINTDSAYSSATGAVSTFIKTAYVQAKFSPEAIVQIGSAGEPWIPFVEDLYGFRYVENTFIDRLKVGNSADWGVHFLGNSGIVSYNVAAVNGGGYKNPTRSKSVDWEGRVSIEPTKGLVFGVGGYTGDLGKNSNAAPTKQTANRFDAVASYAYANFKVGVEYFSENNWGLTTVATPDRGDGYSLFGQYKFNKVWSVFGRYDTDKTSKDLHPLLKDTYYNVGVQCSAIKGVDLALVYKNDSIDNPTSASTVTSYEEFGLFAQIAF